MRHGLGRRPARGASGRPGKIRCIVREHVRRVNELDGCGNLWARGRRVGSRRVRSSRVGSANGLLRGLASLHGGPLPRLLSKLKAHLHLSRRQRSDYGWHCAGSCRLFGLARLGKDDKKVNRKLDCREDGNKSRFDLGSGGSALAWAERRTTRTGGEERQCLGTVAINATSCGRDWGGVCRTKIWEGQVVAGSSHDVVVGAGGMKAGGFSCVWCVSTDEKKKKRTQALQQQERVVAAKNFKVIKEMPLRERRAQIDWNLNRGDQETLGLDKNGEAALALVATAAWKSEELLQSSSSPGIK